MRKSSRSERGESNERKPNIDRSRRAAGDGIANRSQARAEVCCLAGGGGYTRQLRCAESALPLQRKARFLSTANVPEPPVLGGEGCKGNEERVFSELWAVSHTRAAASSRVPRPSGLGWTRGAARPSQPDERGTKPAVTADSTRVAQPGFKAAIAL